MIQLLAGRRSDTHVRFREQKGKELAITPLQKAVFFCSPHLSLSGGSLFWTCQMACKLFAESVQTARHSDAKLGPLAQLRIRPNEATGFHHASRFGSGLVRRERATARRDAADRGGRRRCAAGRLEPDQPVGCKRQKRRDGHGLYL